MDCIAHRGYAAIYPENTCLAVRQASTSADWIEVDARRCGSGEIVTIHDAAVDRVTDASGAVSEFTAAELEALDVLDSGEGVPTLEAALAGVPPSVGVDVEVKEREIAGDVHDHLAGHDGPVLLSLFDAETLRGVREGGDVPLALIGAEDADDVLARADDLGCTAVCLQHDVVDAAVVDRAHEGELAVYAWTVRDRAAANACADAGVDGLIADSPAYCP